MSYLTTGMTVVSDEARGTGRAIHVSTVNVDYYVQVYVAARLLDAKDGSTGLVEFTLGGLSSTDPVFFLSVDSGSATTNLWSEAFPEVDANGNRISVALLQDGGRYNTGDVWRVYLGAKDAAEATIDRYHAPVFPGGRFDYGYGLGTYGSGTYGIDGSAAAGYGSSYGYGAYGFDANYLTWESETMPPGTYPVKVTVEDFLGNVSTAYETTITLATYARPATSTTVTSYVQGTDTLILGFTASPDL